MSWFTLALIAPLIWAIGNLIDDHLLRNVYRSATFGAVISGLFGALPAAYIYFFHRPESIDPKFMLAAIVAGLLTVVFYYFYFKTLENDDPSVAIALNNLAPAIVPFLAFFILSEKLELLQYVGIAIIILGSFMLAALDVKKGRFARSLWFASWGAIAYALVAISAKYAYQGTSFTTAYFWIAIGYGIGGLIALMFLKDKRQLKMIVNINQKKLAALLIGTELLNLSGEVIQGLAINGGPVSIVRGLEGIQPLYVLIIGILFARLFPHHFRERRDARFNRKIACMAFMLAGLFML